MHNMTKVELELISDADRYFFFEKRMAGGVLYIFIRYSKSNNKYLKSYDPKQESKYICLDGNNVYGYLMSKFPPTEKKVKTLIQMNITIIIWKVALKKLNMNS